MYIAMQIIGLSKYMQVEEFELILLGFDFPILTVTDTKKCEPIIYCPDKHYFNLFLWQFNKHILIF